MALDRFRHAGQVLQDVEASLPGKAQRDSAIEARRTCHFLNVAESGAMRCCQLLVEQLLGIAAAKEEVGVETGEVAVDALVASCLLDAIDCGGVCLVGEL